jgi:hypothetical protein
MTRTRRRGARRLALLLSLLAWLPAAQAAAEACPSDWAAVEPRPKNVKAVLALVRACRDAGHADRAEELLLLGLRWAERPDAPAALAIAFLGSHARELTDLYLESGRDEAARLLLRRVGAAVVRRHAPEHLARIASRHAFEGSKRADAGEFERARRELGLALAVYDGAGKVVAEGPVVDGIVVLAATELTLVEATSADYAAAADAWARVVALRERAFGRPHADVTAGWRELAFLQRMAERPDAAGASLQRAYTRDRQAPMPAAALDRLAADGLRLGFLGGIAARLDERARKLRYADPMPADRAALAAALEARAGFLLAGGEVDTALRKFDEAQIVLRDAGSAGERAAKVRAHWFAELLRHLADEQELVDRRNAEA